MAMSVGRLSMTLDHARRTAHSLIILTFVRLADP